MLIVDNYDSFTYNLVQYCKMLGCNTKVIENDELSLSEIKNLKFSKIILSPGWGNPDNSCVSLPVIDYYKDKLPIFGVCLGMQCIAQYFGQKIVRAPEPFHGKNSNIFFDDNFTLFKNLPQGFSATRYHSLVIDNAENKNFKITAWTEDKIPMAIKANGFPLYGVQFHPEAFLTQYGIEIIKNFVEM